MRVLVLVIASRGEAYDAMRKAWDAHRPPDGVDVRFLYGGGLEKRRSETYGGREVTYDIPESVTPGGLDKTVRYLAEEQELEEKYQYVVRTNLSSWFHWARLLDWLADKPRRRFAAGYSPCGTHLSGCNLTLSADLANRLATATLNRDLLDDIAWSPWIFANAARVDPVPRVDLVYESSVILHGQAAAAWHVRLKHADRQLDVRLLESLARQYDPKTDVFAIVEVAAHSIGFS